MDALKGRFTALEESERLLDLCRGEIDVILHGHEHFPIAFDEERSGCIVVSAGTTSEWQADSMHANSFHALMFEGETLRVTQFNWQGARFSRERDWSFLMLLQTTRSNAA